MAKSDAIQTAINRASLMHNVSEDVVKALKSSETHPDLAKIIMTMHHQQQQLDKDLSSLRSSLLTIAHTLNAAADSAVFNTQALELLGKRMGIDIPSLFTPVTTDVSD